MNPKPLYIKNMVCRRCILAVEAVLKEMNIDYHAVKVGEVELASSLPDDKIVRLEEALTAIGLELIDDRRTTMIEKIKRLTLLKARNEVPDEDKPLKLSAYLTQHIPLEYTYMSSLFSEVEGRTIEHYFISQRIEKVKELLVYDQLTLSEIAWELGFSSVAHLSGQFKKVTGLTPSHFKTIGDNRRRPVDGV
jgi:AraC family transcriptional regulator